MDNLNGCSGVLAGVCLLMMLISLSVCLPVCVRVVQLFSLGVFGNVELHQNWHEICINMFLKVIINQKVRMS